MEIKDSNWYLKTLIKAGLFDYGQVKGTIVFKPYGYRIWEKIQKYVDDEFKKLSIVNTYFPLFIPESFLKKEKQHLEGFSPEVAVVTFAGGEELEERLIVRPTSETIIYHFFSQWIKSYRDLPLLINQWSNVVRWEKRPFPFLRNTEFLWQEGHTAHASHQEAIKFALNILKIYQKIYQEILGIYGYAGKKSKNEKFAGAKDTYTYEILLPDGKALQGCTSHDLGQNFSKAFEVKFQDQKGQIKYVWQTSFGITTRTIGALSWVHGDNRGLVFPPTVSPYQIVIVPIYTKEKTNKTVYNKIKFYIERMKKILSDYEFIIDQSEHTPGYKFNEWDLKGVPLRIEIGKKEVEQKKLTIFRRDKQQRLVMTLEELENNLSFLLKEIQINLYTKSKEFTEKNTRFVKSYEEFKKVIFTNKGFVRAFWCEQEKCEFKIKEETKATTRCLPLNSEKSSGRCIYCKQKSENIWLFAQSY